MKTLESLDAQEKTLAQEFLKRIESLGEAISGIVRPWNVVEIHPSSMIILPEKEESVLYVLELVIQPADRKLCISKGSGGITADNALDSSAATNISEYTMRMSSTVDRDSTAVESKFTQKLPEI